MSTSKPKSSTWRVVLFRAIRDGNIEMIEFVCERHVTAIHENFTRDMHHWELEWDSLRWFDLCNATALFLACAFTKVNVVEWLMHHGVDTEIECGHHQKAADTIGLCNGNEEENEKILALLGQKRMAFKAPRQPTGTAKASYEEKTFYPEEESQKIQEGEGTDAMTPSPPSENPTPVNRTVAVCRATFGWNSYWIRPRILFQVRYRVEESVCSTTEAEDDEDEMKLRRWKYEEVLNHNIVIRDMLPGRTYAVQSRAQNPVGGAWSDWSEAAVKKMPLPKGMPNSEHAILKETSRRDLIEETDGRRAEAPVVNMQRTKFDMTQTLHSR